MTNSEYWQERLIQLEEAQHKTAQQTLTDIVRIYREVKKELEGDIAAWYTRFADGNDVDMTLARRMLTARELEEFQWDVREYIRRGAEYGVSGAWAKQLENASCRYHISRLEALKVRVQNSLETLYGKYNKTLSSALLHTYESGYYYTAYELQKGFGIGWDIASLNQREIEKVLAKPWAADGYNFSQRLWRNKEKLLSTIHTGLSRNILLGQDPKKAIDRVAKTMETSRHNAGRLVMTESAYFSSAAQGQAYHDLGVEQYEILATLDGHTSEICRNMDGKRFAMKDYQAGITAPPFHVYCRSTTIPYDPDFGADAGQRAARGEDGKTYYVPADMTYREWEKTFVQGGEKKGLEKAAENDIISPMDITNEWIGSTGTKGRVTEKQEYIVNGVVYKVDGKQVVLKPTEKERIIAAILSEKYGKSVELVPQVMYPLGIQTPDYLIDGERFDLKSPTGNGKNVLYNMISKKKKQSPNFIFDVSDCPLEIEEIERQIWGLYRSQHTQFIEKILVMRFGKIVHVYSKK